MSIYLLITGCIINSIGYAFLTFLLGDRKNKFFDAKWLKFILILSIYMIAYNITIPVSDNTIYRAISTIFVMILLNKYLIKKEWKKSMFDTMTMYALALIGEIGSAVYVIGVLDIKLETMTESFILMVVMMVISFLAATLILILVEKYIFRKNDVRISNLLVLNLLLLSVGILITGKLIHKAMYYWADYSGFLETGIFSVAVLIAFFSMFILILYLVNKENLAKRKLLKIEKEYTFDNVTRCLNRSIGIEKIEQTIIKSRSFPIDLTICYIDVNELKKVNDTYGHSKGDEMLKLICDIIRANLRSNDLMIRYGGDEFILFLYEVDESKALEIIERVNNQLKQIDFVCDLSFAFGFKSFMSDETIFIDDFINEADKKMYEKKKNMKSLIVS